MMNKDDPCAYDAGSTPGLASSRAQLPDRDDGGAPAGVADVLVSKEQLHAALLVNSVGR
jgi:hypothetical protein